MRSVDGRLSTFARVRLRDKTAVVYVEEDGRYVLERREHEPLGLGDHEHGAQRALYVLGSSR